MLSRAVYKMTDLAKIISFRIEQGSTGLLFVRSDELPTILLSGRDLDTIKAQLKAVVREHYKRQHQINVEIIEAVNEADKNRSKLLNSLVAIPHPHNSAPKIISRPMVLCIELSI